MLHIQNLTGVKDHGLKKLPRVVESVFSGKKFDDLYVFFI